MKRRRVVVGLVVLAIALAGALVLWHARVSREPCNVLLITLDTTRADRLGCYGYAPAETPALDALARGGVRFTRAYTHVPLTLPSHTTMLTGLLPPEHGVHDNGRNALDPAIRRWPRRSARTATAPPPSSRASPSTNASAWAAASRFMTTACSRPSARPSRSK